MHMPLSDIECICGGYRLSAYTGGSGGIGGVGNGRGGGCGGSGLGIGPGPGCGRWRTLQLVDLVTRLMEFKAVSLRADCLRWFAPR